MMGFFNEDFYKELDKNIDVSEEDDNDEFVFDDEDDFDSTNFSENMNLQVNKSNQDKFKNIMSNASSKFDTYWDFNNPVIRIILVILAAIIVIGLVYYIVGWFTLFK